MKKIEARNIHKSFQELNVLQGIDLDVEEGEVIAVIGPSGSGKSTLLRCLNKLETINRARSLLTVSCLLIPAAQVRWYMHPVTKAAELPVKWEWCFSSLTCFRI